MAKEEGKRIRRRACCSIVTVMQGKGKIEFEIQNNLLYLGNFFKNTLRCKYSIM